MLFGGLQFGHVVDQVNVHVLDRVRFLLVGHPQVYDVIRGRRGATATTTATAFVVIFRVLLLLVLLVMQLLMLLLLMLELLMVLLDDCAVLHILLDLGRHERAQAPRLGRRHELHATRRGPAPAARHAVLLYQIVAGLLQLLVVLLLQVQLVRGGVQQRVISVVVVVQLRLVRRRPDRLVPDDALHFSEVPVPHVPEVLVLVAVRTVVLVVVRRFSHVPVFVRHLAAVLVVVHHFAGVDQRYALAGQLVRVHVVHVMRHFFRHDYDDPVVSAQNQVSRLVIMKTFFFLEGGVISFFSLVFLRLEYFSPLYVTPLFIKRIRGVGLVYENRIHTK